MKGGQTPMASVRKLSDVVVAGRDYEAKVKITELLDHDVMMTGFDHVIIMKEVTLADGSKEEIEDANYYNVKVDDGGVKKTFSTGAQPIVKVLEVLDKEDLPLICTFRKQGQTYIVE
jgi:hypothetical protein